MTDPKSIAQNQPNHASSGELSESRGIFRSARLISLLTLLSRLLGAVRDTLAAHVFGAGFIWDAFLIAWLVPNLFRRILGEGALSGAFIPVYNETIEKKSREDANHLASNVLTLTAIVLLILVIVGVGIFTALQIQAVSGSKAQLIYRLAAILIPYMFFICLTAVLTGILHSHKSFFIPAAAPIVLNVLWIGALLSVWGFKNDSGWGVITVISFCIVGGGMVQFGMQLPVLKRCGFHYTYRATLKDPNTRKVLHKMAPVALGLGMVQFNTLSDSIIAELFVQGDGAVSILYYGNRLMQFPLALIGIAMAVAAFPTLSKLSAKNENKKMAAALIDSCRVTFFFALPASVGIVLLREPLISLLFGHGAFQSGGEENVMRCSMVLAMYGIGIWAYCLSQVLIRAFYAIGDSITPFRLSVWMVIFNLGLNLLFVRWMREAGLALATSTTGILYMVLLMILLHRRLQLRLPTGFWNNVMRVCAASAMMGLACYGTYQWSGTLADPASLHGKLVLLFLPFSVGLAVYFLMAWIVKLDELKTLHR